MTQTTQETETVEQTEQRLWSEYMSALTGNNEAQRMREEAWRKYVASTLKDMDACGEWERYMDLEEMLEERKESAYAAWKKVAYPLYGLARLLKDKDDD